MLRIADLEFAITSCRLEAYCSADQMSWDIEVECAPHSEGQFYGRSPLLSLRLFATPPKAFSHWTELAPREVQWRDKHDTDVVPSGMLYIFEHTPVFACHAQCRLDARTMHIEATGKCDVYYGEQYDMDLDWHLSSPVVFRGVLCGREPEAVCRKAIALFLNPNDFAFTLTEDGISILTPKAKAKAKWRPK